jgi:hypothetical protein
MRIEMTMTCCTLIDRQTAQFLRRACIAMLWSALIAPDATGGYPVPQQPRLFEQQVSNEVRCVVTVETAIWKQDEPALIHIRLENLTDKDLDFETVPTLYLKNVQDTYWSPTDILRNQALDVRRRPFGKKAAAERIEPISMKVHLDKHGSSVFEVDAAKTNWAREISSIWPKNSLRALPREPYRLRLELDEGGSLVRSNEVKVTLAK